MYGKGWRPYLVRARKSREVATAVVVVVAVEEKTVGGVLDVSSFYSCVSLRLRLFSSYFLLFSVFHYFSFVFTFSAVSPS